MKLSFYIPGLTCTKDHGLKFIKFLFIAVLVFFISETNGFAQVYQFFYPSANYTWTAPNGVTQIDVLCWGAGGAGGGSSNASYGGVGGGGGGYTSGVLNVNSGQTYNIVVGAGGVPVTGAAGGNGGYSSFNYPTMVSGGGGGGGAGAPGGSGGTGDGGSPGTPGISGTAYNGGFGGVPFDATQSGGGGGAAGSGGQGSSAYGWQGGAGELGSFGSNIGFDGNGANGVSGQSSPTAGTAGDVWSGGGSGGLSGNGTPVMGGAGADGLVVVTYIQPYVWTGAHNTEWEDTLNWQSPNGGQWPGQVGTTTDIAVINANPHNHLPAITAADGAISLGQIKISGSGITLTLGANSYVKVNCPYVVAGFGGGLGVELTNNGALSADPTSTVDYAADNFQTIGPAVYGNLKVSTPSTTSWLKTIPGSPACTVKGDLSIVAAIGLSGPTAPTVRIDTQTIILKGNLLQSGPSGGGQIYGTGGINMTAANTGSATITPNNANLSLSNLIVSGPVTLLGGFQSYYAMSTVLVTSSFTIATNLQIGSTFNNNFGTVIINNAYTLSLGAYGFSNSGDILSGMGNGGTIQFQASHDTVEYGYGYSFADTAFLPSGHSSHGMFGGNGSLLSIKGTGTDRTYPTGTNGGYLIFTLDEANVSNLSIYNLSVGTSNANYPVNLYLAAGETLSVYGNTFQNWYTDAITGLGTIQFNGNVSLPSGSGGGAGTFDNTPGSITSVSVGDGTTINTVTVTSAMTENNLTVNSGAIMAVNNSITDTVAGNFTCNGTVQDGSGPGQIYMNGGTIGGGISVAHGHINISTFSVAGSEGGTVNSSGTNVTWLSGNQFATDGSWNGQYIPLGSGFVNGYYSFNGYVNVFDSLVTWVGGAQWPTAWDGDQSSCMQISGNNGGGCIQTVVDNTHIILNSFSNSHQTLNSVFYEAYFYVNPTPKIDHVVDATHLVLAGSANAGVTGNTPWYYSVAAPANILSSAYLDVSATTTVKGLQNQTITNNGHLNFLGDAFGPGGSNCFLSQGTQSFVNSATGNLNVTGTYYGGYNSTTTNNGTMTSTKIDLSNSYPVVNNNGVAHVGTGGVIGSPYGNSTIWNNNAGSSVDVAGPFLEPVYYFSYYYTAGVVNASSATNTVTYDGTGTQVIFPTTYNNLTINKSGGSATLVSPVTGVTNATVNGTLTFQNGSVTTGSDTVIFTSTGNASGASQSTGWVNGNVEKAYGAGSTSFNFAVGDATEYAPTNMTISGVSGAVNVSEYIASSDANEVYVSGIDQSNKANRYWFLSEAGGGSFTNYNATFDFSHCSPQGTISSYGLAQFNPNTWVIDASTVNVGNNTITANGLTNFGDFETGVSGGSSKATLNLTIFHQGYYVGGGLMQQVLYNEGVQNDPNTTDVDTFTISLVDPNNGNFVQTTKGLLQTDGSLTVQFLPSAIGNSYYIYIQHRNSIETSSASPVTIALTTSYSFSSNASQAYGNNEIQIDNGIWAIYTGDLNQDCYIDPFDFPQYDADVSNQVAAVYVNTDMNGDGYVDPFDFPVYDGNVSNQIACNNPF